MTTAPSEPVCTALKTNLGQPWCTLDVQQNHRLYPNGGPTANNWLLLWWYTLLVTSGHRAAGNPYVDGQRGGGAGCHFANYDASVGLDQTDAEDSHGDYNLVRDPSCQCNSGLKGGDWSAWVKRWIMCRCWG